MLDRTKHVIPLSAWHIEKRGKWFYIVRQQFFRQEGREKGPYSSIVSACLMIARELIKEATA